MVESAFDLIPEPEKDGEPEPKVATTDSDVDSSGQLVSSKVAAGIVVVAEFVVVNYK